MGWWDRLRGRELGDEEERRRVEMEEAFVSGMRRRDVEAYEAEAISKWRLAAELEESGHDDLAEATRREARAAELAADARRYGADDWMQTILGGNGHRDA
jgi:hypothetical protein